MSFRQSLVKILMLSCFITAVIILKYSLNMNSIFEDFYPLQRPKDHQSQHSNQNRKAKNQQGDHVDNETNFLTTGNQHREEKMEKFLVTASRTSGRSVEKPSKTDNKKLLFDHVEEHDSNYRPNIRASSSNRVRLWKMIEAHREQFASKNLQVNRILKSAVTYKNNSGAITTHFNKKFADESSTIVSRAREIPPAQKTNHFGKNFQHQISFSGLKNLVESADAKNLSTVEDTSPKETVNLYLQNIGNYSIYGDSNCKKGSERKVLQKLFEKWILMANESGIEYFLSCGTLLGSYRNGELIPYDSDMDVLLHRTEYKKLKKYETRRKFTGYEKKFHFVIQKDFEKTYEKRTRYTCKGLITPVYKDHCSFVEPLARLITENRHLDIYDYTIKDNKIYDPSEGGRTFEISDVFPLQKCMLMGHETKCPNKPEKFLQKFYGKNLYPNKICRNGKWVKLS